MSEKSICIIDPYENVFNVYRMILEEKGFKVSTITDLDQAQEDCHYTIIITEFFSPVDKTCQFIQSVKTKSPETYLIMSTSAIFDDPTYKTLFDAGLDDVLIKPYGQEKLLAHIEKGIKRQALFIEHKKTKKGADGFSDAQEDFPGVYGPVYFKKLLRQEIKKAKRHQQPISLILLKLPSKDRIGARFGSFYIELIELLQNSLREEDLLGRENGNLGIILDKTDETGSQILGRRLSKLIQTHPSFQSNLSYKDIIKELAFQYYTFPIQKDVPDFLAPLLKEIDIEFPSN
jgi:two-component system, cell cycle response regulator